MQLILAPSLLFLSPFPRLLIPFSPGSLTLPFLTSLHVLSPRSSTRSNAHLPPFASSSRYCSASVFTALSTSSFPFISLDLFYFIVLPLLLSSPRLSAFPPPQYFSLAFPRVHSAFSPLILFFCSFSVFHRGPASCLSTTGLCCQLSSDGGLAGSGAAFGSAGLVAPPSMLSYIIGPWYGYCLSLPRWSRAPAFSSPPCLLSWRWLWCAAALPFDFDSISQQGRAVRLPRLALSPFSGLAVARTSPFCLFPPLLPLFFSAAKPVDWRLSVLVSFPGPLVVFSCAPFFLVLRSLGFSSFRGRAGLLPSFLPARFPPSPSSAALTGHSDSSRVCFYSFAPGSLCMSFSSGRG